MCDDRTKTADQVSALAMILKARQNSCCTEAEDEAYISTSEDHVADLVARNVNPDENQEPGKSWRNGMSS